LLAFVTALFGFLDRVGQYFANQQLINAGKAEQAVAVQEKVEANVVQAQLALDLPDATRTGRLRSRFDRSQATGNE
jgi:hypothetical protein